MPNALIIEDEEDNRRILVNLVKAENHAYKEASCLDEARRLLESEDFDFVLLDLKIPFAPGDIILRDHGDRCLREIRAHPRNGTAGVVVVTSSDDRDVAVEKMREGASDYIWKPLQEQKRKLSECIAIALKHRDELRQRSHSSGNGHHAFLGATLMFTDDRILLDDCVLCSSVTTKQAKVIRFLAEHHGERPTGEMIASDLGYNEGNQGGSASVHKALFLLKDRAKKHFQAVGMPVGAKDFIANNRGSSGYEFGPKIRIEGLGAQKSKRKAQ